MAVITGIIVVEDGEGERSSFKVYMLNEDVNHDAVSLQICLNTVFTIAYQLVFPNLIEGRIADYYIVAHGNPAIMPGNPAVGSGDIERRAKITIRNEGGFLRTIRIPTLDESTIVPGTNELNYDIWENSLGTLTGNAFGLAGQPVITDKRGIPLSTLEDTVKDWVD